jgi:hypothetical protein
MTVVSPGSDRPAAIRPAAHAKDCVSLLFCLRARNAATSRQGKKAGVAVAGRRSRRSRPPGLIRSFEEAQDASRQEANEDNHDAWQCFSRGFDRLCRKHERCAKLNLEADNPRQGDGAISRFGGDRRAVGIGRCRDGRDIFSSCMIDISLPRIVQSSNVLVI